MLNLICLIPVLAVGWAPADETSGPFNGLDRQVRLTGKPTLTEAIDQVAAACDVRIFLQQTCCTSLLLHRHPLIQSIVFIYSLDMVGGDCENRTHYC